VDRPPLGSDSPLATDVTDAPAEQPKKKDKGGVLGFFKELPVLILIAFGLAILIKTFLVQAFYIPSESMVPTLEVGDRVLVNKLIYRFRNPHRGEVIVFIAEHNANKNESVFDKVIRNIKESIGVAQPPDRDFIKRIIGLPGETVEMKDAIVTVTTADGKKLKLDEPYISKQKDTTSFGPTKVPPESYFVMGDNRPFSQDSRFRGPIRRSDIIGKAFIKVWPPSRISLMRTPKYGTPAAAGFVVALPVWLAWRRRRHRRRDRARPAA
jgi:signal peptidase I